MTKFAMHVMFASLLLVTVSRPAAAVDKFWDGGGGNSSWATPANWNPDGVPQPGDAVVIDVPGPLTVMINANVPSIASLTCTNGVTVSAGSALQVDGTSTFAPSSVLTLSAGSFSSGNTAVIDGTLVFNGTIGGAGQVVVGPNGVLQMTSFGSRSLQGTLILEGSGTWSAGTISFFNGLFQVDGTLVVGAAGDITTFAGGVPSVLRVNGTLAKVGAGTLTLVGTNGVVKLENNGVVDVQQGTLSCAGGATNLIGSELNGGVWRVSSTLLLSTTALATLAADVTIESRSAQLLATSGAADLLASLTTITPAGALRLANGRVQPNPLALVCNGTLDIDETSKLLAQSSLAFGPSATYSIEFGSDGMGGFVNGSSTVIGSVTLGGLVRAVQVDGYVPAQCDELVIVNAGSVSGKFDAQDLPPVSTFPIWTVSTLATSVTLFFADSDLDNNLLVDGGDLGILLSQWGGSGSGDLDCGGVVGGGDLGVLLSSWGAAP